jgi:enediyne biosynthesis protein E4
MRVFLALVAALAWAAIVLAPATTGEPWAVSFVDVAARAGLRDPSVYGALEQKRFIIETNGAGVALVDVDNDGWVDALVLNGTRLEEGTRRDKAWPPGQSPTSHLYHNNRDGTFTDVTERAGLTKTGWASSVCAGDYDNDGFIDLFVTYFGQNVLYHNRGDGRFEDVTVKAGFPTAGTRWGSGCSFIDYDRDGKLDLFVANYLSFDLQKALEPGEGVNCLWKGIPVNCGPKGLPTDTNLLFHNKGDGTFEDVSEASGIATVTNRYPMTAAAADLDGDGWTDIYVACDSTPAIFYRNNRDGTFTDVALASGAGYSEFGNLQAGMGVAVGDYDSDGRLDLLKTHFADDIPALYRNFGRGQFEDVATAVGLAARNRFVEWGAGMPDLDNDGRPDIFYVTGNVYPEIERHFKEYPHRGPRIVFRNAGEGRFEDVTEKSGPGPVAPHSSRGAAFGDFDNDGDLDVLIMNMNEPPTLLRNDLKNANGWIEVQLEGTRSNRAGIGATVVVTAGGRAQARAALSQSSYYSHDDLRLHFGLGAASRADTVEVRWPSGMTDMLKDVAGRRVVRIREGASPRPEP